MGRCQKGRGRARLGQFFNDPLPFLLLISLLASGCHTVPEAEPTNTPLSPTNTPKPTLVVKVSPTLEPTAIEPPEATFTPGPAIILSQIHPEVAYINPITVQHVTQESIHCYFELDQAAEGFLFYWPLGGSIQEGGQVALGIDSSRHLIEIDGLLPGVEYQIAVGIHDGNGSYLPPQFLSTMWDPIQVQTSSTDLWPLRIAIFGDSGFGDEITHQLAAEMASLDLDFILHTGDVVYQVYKNSDVQEAYAIKYYQALSPILKRFPLYAVLGNHEYDEEAFFEEEPYYFHVFPLLPGAEQLNSNRADYRRWYAIELEPFQFLMLDTQLFWRGTGRSDQTAWLSERLSDAQFKYSIPVFHVPPFTSGRHGLDGVFVQRDWLPLFEQAEVPLVLSGHDHNYERLSFNGITYVVTGGGSSVLYPLRNTLPQSDFFAWVTHFVLLEIFPETLTISAITPDGEVIDQFSLDYSER